MADKEYFTKNTLKKQVVLEKLICLPIKKIIIAPDREFIQLLKRLKFRWGKEEEKE